MEELDGLELGYDAFAEGAGGYSPMPNYELPNDPMAPAPAPFKPWLEFTRPKDRLQGKMDDAIRRSQREDDKATAMRMQGEYDDLKATIPDLDARIGDSLGKAQALPPEMGKPQETMGEGIAQIISNLMGMPVGQVADAKNKRMTERRDREFGNEANKHEATVRNAQMDYRHLQGEKANTLGRMEGLKNDVEGIEKFWRDFDAEVELDGIKTGNTIKEIGERGTQERLTAAEKQRLTNETVKLKDSLGTPKALYEKLMEVPGMTPEEAWKRVDIEYQVDEANRIYTEAKTKTENDTRGPKTAKILQDIKESKARVDKWNADISRDNQKLGLDLQKFLSGEAEAPPDNKDIEKEIRKFRTTQEGNTAKRSALEREALALPPADQRTDAQKARATQIRKEQAELKAENESLNAKAHYLRKVTKLPKADAPNGASWASPVAGYRVSSGFGPRSKPNAKASSNHKGLDMAIPIGTAVKATRDGVVVSAGKAGTYGNLVVIRHADGTTSRYGHLQGFDVKPGQTVKGGQKIARSGNSGNSTGPHLHFEIRDSKGNALDPAKHIK